MGKELDPRISLHSPWQFSNSNCASNVHEPDRRPQNTNPMLCLPSMSPATAFPGICPNKPFQQTPASIPTLFPSHNPQEFDQFEKRFVVFDQSRDGKNFIFSLSSSHFPCLNSTHSGFGLQGCTGANASDRQGVEEMHEDTEEINALLYSDSDDEETSTGHSPNEMMEKTSSEVASSMHPVKRRRLDVDELDTSILDTASSAVIDNSFIPTDCGNKEDDDSAESSCVKGAYFNVNTGDKQLKRARIQETVHVLRSIIPGGKGNDTATILDEAICYLKSLKLKVQSHNAPL
ncbi:transcription factor bHLH143 [Canna indica]|uniref:Transcription factor bHLH143 n=1 Tax=Canna indica TaxID=4628 RepID=A0AAQ3Q935_9LILI|nr:transcription factor bHLH143 [Canna indica]